MLRRIRASAALLIGLLFVSLSAQAAIVSYFMDQSNEDTALPDGTNYLLVDIEDVGDDIRFTVSLLPALTSIAGTNFGIQTFAFNTLVLGITSANITMGPAGWSGSDNDTQDGFGNFLLNLSGTGSNRQAPTLQFFITGVVGDSPSDYAALSSGTAGQGNQFFAAHVADFDAPGGVDSAFFGGSTLVPLPATLSLLLTGIAGLGLVARRRRSSAPA